MGKEINIRDLDVITDIDESNVGSLFTQFADYVWNNRMGDWFIHVCNVMLGRDGALDGYKDEYLRYANICLTLLRSDEKIKLANDIIKKLVDDWELPDRDLKRLGVTNVDVNSGSVNGILRRIFNGMWNYEDPYIIVDYLDQAVENPAIDRDIEGTRYDAFINRLTQKGKYDLLQPIIAAAINNISKAGLEDELDVDHFFLQEKVELDEADNSQGKINQVNSLIR